MFDMAKERRKEMDEVRLHLSATTNLRPMTEFEEKLFNAAWSFDGRVTHGSWMEILKVVNERV